MSVTTSVRAFSWKALSGRPATRVPMSWWRLFSPERRRCQSQGPAVSATLLPTANVTTHLEALDDPDEVIQVKSWIQQHVEHTGSALARDIIAQWGSAVRRFVKVLPIEYKRYLMQQKEVRNHG